MKSKSFLRLLAAAGPGAVLAMGPGRAGHGMIGYGIDIYKPYCAFSCRDTISSATLACSTIMMADDMAGMSGMDMDMGMVTTDPECYATDDAFLQTLAVCLDARCAGTIPAWQIEKYWKDNVAGYLSVQPDPKETFQQALAKVNGTPTAVYVEGALNETSVVPDEAWEAAYVTNNVFAHQESQQVRYG